MREIGSEFWKSGKQHIQQNETFYLVGRTALDAIIKDVVKSYNITSALLPSYCCHTMIEPFLINGINVRFYDVYVNKYNALIADIPSPRKSEMLYIMKYFGDTELCYEGEGKSLSGWTTSVEDLTHSCFSKEAFHVGDSVEYTTGYSENAYLMGRSSAEYVAPDYWFTSYRKWFGVAGIAVAGKRNGKLPEPRRGQNRVYSVLRNQAFSLKQQYIDGKSVKKQEFLDIFRQTERLLGEDYRDFGVGYEEIYDLFRFMDGIEDVHCKRRGNANILIDGLAGVEGIKVFVDFQDDKKCPLFVPVIVEGGMRDSLRNYLVSKDIYCPVHWPLWDQHEGLSERAVKLYEQELSIVCDQRYDGDDMERTIQLVKGYFKEQLKLR